MSVPMVELAHVEALWAHVPAREEDLQALRESAVPGADAHEVSVILPAGWVPLKQYLDVPNHGRYCIFQQSTGNRGYLIQRTWHQDYLDDNGRFCYGQIGDAYTRPDLQSAVNALAKALEGGA